MLVAGTPLAPLTSPAVFITLRGDTLTPYVPANGPEGTKVVFVDGGQVSMVGVGPYTRAHKVVSTVGPALVGSRTALQLYPTLTRAVPGDRVGGAVVGMVAVAHTHTHTHTYTPNSWYWHPVHSTHTVMMKYDYLMTCQGGWRTPIMCIQGYVIVFEYM